MKKWMLVGCLFVGFSAFSQEAQGEIIGTIIDKNTKEIIYGAEAYVQDVDKKYQAITDVDGRFRISAIPSGTYELLVKYRKDTISNRIEVVVPMDGICNAGTILFSKEKEFKAITVYAQNNDRVKLEYGFLPVKKITSEEIAHSSAKFDIKSLATSMSSEVKVDENGDLMFRGARKGDMIYMLDGMKSTQVFNVPSCSIANMMVYTGGIPAKYGDTMGGVIVVETKGYFDLYRDWKRSEAKKEAAKN